MSKTPQVIDLVVKNDLCIGCGLCTYKCTNKALEMKWNEFGFLIPELSGNCNCDGSCLTICPFNPYPEEEVKTENELADLYLKDAIFSHPQVGKYIGIYAGYAEEFRLTSSSGGIATFILADLLERGIVNHIFSVKESSNPGIHYDYSISNNKLELLASSKTRYYPVSLSTVFSKIDSLEGKVAIVGVACFIKAIRLAQHFNPVLKDKIPFLVGIICGGVKSRFFAEYLADKSGVQNNLFYKPEFRIKDLNTNAGDYSFGCNSQIDNQKRTIKMRSVGDMWGTGLFKANACDFCDDVTTELADISLGDAWIEPYIKDGNGTNVLVIRTLLAERLIMEGIESRKLILNKLSLEKLILSQQGSFNHRQKGISVRINQAIKTNQLVPPKRFSNNQLSIDYKMVQFYRRIIRRKSLKSWKNSKNSYMFDKNMKRNLLFLKTLTYLYHFKIKMNNRLGIAIHK